MIRKLTLLTAVLALVLGGWALHQYAQASTEVTNQASDAGRTYFDVHCSNDNVDVMAKECAVFVTERCQYGGQYVAIRQSAKGQAPAWVDLRVACNKPPFDVNEST